MPVQQNPLRIILFKLVALAVLCLLSVYQGSLEAAGESPSAVKRTSEQTVAVDVETQKAVDAWAAEEKELLEKIDRSERALRRALWEQNKTAEYLKTLEDKMAELREKAEEMKKINAELLPILDQGAEKLAHYVEDDLPFDKARRFGQVEEVTHTLNDYDVDLLAKTRGLFDAVAREVDFGYSVDIREAEIDIGGRSTRVQLLKVGRVGLYALSMDGEKAYMWDASQKHFVPVDGDARDIDEAVRIVKRIRIIELTRLPMGRPVPGSAAEGASHE